MSLSAVAYNALVVLCYEICEWTIAGLVLMSGFVVGAVIRRFTKSTLLCFICAELALIVLCFCSSRSDLSALLSASRSNPLLIWNALGFLPAIASILIGYRGSRFLENINGIRLAGGASHGVNAAL